MDIKTEISKLNPRQHEAAMHTEGPLLLLAGAGTGKTKTLTMRAANLVYKGVPPKQILAVTFTNKAANEMRERVLSLFDGDKKKSPVISTFHSFCLNTVLRHEIMHLGYQRNFTVFDSGEQMSLIRNLMGDIESEKSFKADLLMENISKVKNGMLRLNDPKRDGKELSEVMNSLYDKYHVSMKTFNVVDFDDLLLLTLRLFREHPDVLRKYQDRFIYIMVDEYQDTNSVQYELVRLLAGERKNLCCVGDDDQSIYTFRGADIRNILDFEKDFPGARVIKLEQNYRSHGHILAAANSVIRNNKSRKEKALWTDKGSGDQVSIMKARDDEDEAGWVAEKISMIKYYDKDKAFEEFAVIYRSNNLSRPFEEALRKDRIPYTVVGGTSYFDRKEIRDIAAYLKIIANPKDDLSLLRIANIPKRGLGTTTLGRVANFAKEHSIPLLDAFKRAEEIPDLGPHVVKAAVDFAEMIGRYRERFDSEKGLKDILHDLISGIGYKDYLREFYKTPEVAVKRVGSVDTFTDSISRYEAEEETPSLSGLLSTLALTDMDGKKGKDSFGVTLISIHSSKGLEFPVVFLVGLETDILPHRKSMAGDGIEEERRLFYVGITRAMEQLFITYAGSRVRYGTESPSEPSIFLGELDKGAIEHLDRMKQEDPEEREKKAKAFFANIQAMLNQ